MIWLKYNIVPKLQIAFNLGLLPKIRIISRKVSNESCSKLNFVQKSSRAHISFSTQSGAKGLERLIWYGTETTNYIKFRAWRCQKGSYQKYALLQKKLQMKVVQNWTLYRKVRKCICLISPLSGARAWLIWCGTETANCIQFRAQCCQKGSCQNYPLLQKKLQMKVVQNWISCQKVHEELRTDFSISVWSINRNWISENCKRNWFFETRFNWLSKNRHHF